MTPEALDLLEKMLIFDPNKRIAGILEPEFQAHIYSFFIKYNFSHLFHIYVADEALSHPYLASLHNINDEPVCPRPFSFDFEQPTCTEEDVKELIWRESVKFNPDPPCH